MSEGYREVDALMDKVYKAIGRHLPQSSDGAVDIYNRAYETVASVYSQLAAVTPERDRANAERQCGILTEDKWNLKSEIEVYQGRVAALEAQLAEAEKAIQDIANLGLQRLPVDKRWGTAFAIANEHVARLSKRGQEK